MDSPLQKYMLQQYIVLSIQDMLLSLASYWKGKICDLGLNWDFLDLFGCLVSFGTKSQIWNLIGSTELIASLPTSLCLCIMILLVVASAFLSENLKTNLCLKFVLISNGSLQFSVCYQKYQQYICIVSTIFQIH